MAKPTQILKHKQVLDQLIELIQKTNRNSRLPPMRQLMTELMVSQGVIERCLVEMECRGLIRRKNTAKRGFYVSNGVKRSSKILGIYDDIVKPAHLPSNNVLQEPQSPSFKALQLANNLFIQGARVYAEDQGYHVAHFGTPRTLDYQNTLIQTIDELNLAGLLIAGTSGQYVYLEANLTVENFQDAFKLPLVTCRPLPAIQADTVMPDYFTAFEKLGQHLVSIGAKPPVFFLGHQGIPSLIRMEGLRTGLGGQLELHCELLDGHHESMPERLKELQKNSLRGSLVIGVPSHEPEEIALLRGFKWQAGSGHELAITRESTQWLPPNVRAHQIVRPSFHLGQTAARLLLERIQGLPGQIRHMYVPHELIFQ